MSSGVRAVKVVPVAVMRRTCPDGGTVATTPEPACGNTSSAGPLWMEGGPETVGAAR
jgi:hypothetical protein